MVRVKPDDGGKNGRRVYVGNLPFFGDDKRRFRCSPTHIRPCPPLSTQPTAAAAAGLVRHSCS